MIFSEYPRRSDCSDCWAQLHYLFSARNQFRCTFDSRGCPLIVIEAKSIIPELTITSFARLVWHIFLLDRCGSIMTNLPAALPDECDSFSQIETVWPRTLEEYECVRMTISGITASLSFLISNCLWQLHSCCFA